MTALVLAVFLGQLGEYPQLCGQPLHARSVFRVGAAVVAPTDGIVTAVTPTSVRFRACAYENHQVIDVELAVSGASTVSVEKGARLPAGTSLATGGTVTLDGTSARAFFAKHPYLFQPGAEAVLLVVEVDAHEATLYERGVRTHHWEVGHGQAEGKKERRGDLKTPRGLYFVTNKSTGPFSGPVAEYYGGHWVKVNYPNAFDAAAGGLSTEKQEVVARAWWRRELTLQNTSLGGGIGFHGWVSPWTAEGQGFALSWGCVVAHPEDIAGLYASLPVGAAVVLR